MKTNRSYFSILPLILVLAGSAMAADHVDIGNPASESGYVMSSWGPIEPLTSSGSYGGIDECRAIWSSSDNSRSASIDLVFAGGTDPESVSFRHLEGMADDGFEVYIDGTLRYTHVEATTNEEWYVDGFFVTGLSAGTHTVTFVATGAQWGSWGSFGQVCIAGIWVGPGGPVPAENSTWGGVKALYR